MDAAIRLNSGKAMPMLGIGTWQSEGDEVKVAVLKALELGYRHIDTAYLYQNEDQIGEALKEAFKREVVVREDVFVTSKLPHQGHRPEKVKYFLRKSLKSLGLDYLDLYLIHWPVSTVYTDDDTMHPVDKDGKIILDEDLDLLDVWKALEECVDEGLTKSIGLSNFNSVQIKRIYDNARIKPANLQVECHVYFQQEKLVKFCSDLDITVTAYAPLGSPGLAAFAKKRFNVDAPKRKQPLEEPVLQEISKKYGKTAAQVAIRFLIQRGLIVIPKSTKEERIKENADVFDFALSDEDMEQLKEVDAGLRSFSYGHSKEMTSSPKYPYHEEF